MEIAYIIILIASLFLLFYGNLNFWLALPLLILSIGGLFLILKNHIRAGVQYHHLSKTKKLKWVGKFSLIEGFDLVPNQDMYLGLTHHNSLIFVSTQQENQISLEQVEGMLVIKGSDFLRFSDERLRLFLNRESTTSVFSNVRNLIQGESRLRREKFLLISLKNPLDAFQNKRLNRDFIVLSFAFNHGHFTKFIKNPEIRDRIRHYHKKTANVNLSKDKLKNKI